MTVKSNFGVIMIAKLGKWTLAVDITTMFPVLYFTQRLNLFFQILKTKVFEFGICRRERVFRFFLIFWDWEFLGPGGTFRFFGKFLKISKKFLEGWGWHYKTF